MFYLYKNSLHFIERVIALKGRLYYIGRFQPPPKTKTIKQAKRMSKTPNKLPLKHRTKRVENTEQNW